MKRILFLFLLGVLCLPVAAIAEPLEQVGSSVPGMSCELKKLYRKNGVLTAKWDIVTDESFSSSRYEFRFRKKDSSCSYAVDQEKGVKYFPLTDKEGTPLSSAGSMYLRSNKKFGMWMKMPAPPAEVTSISVVVTFCEPFDDIDITDK